MEALQRLHNRGSISTGYDIENSLKFETDNSEYLKAEGRSQGDSQQTWTWSCWVKRTEVDNGVVAQYIFSAGSDGKLGLYFRDDSSSNGGDTIFIYVDEGNSLKWIGELRVSFRDTSAWYHIVFAVDSTDSTPADRTKIYINGVQQTITFNSTLNQNVSTRVGDNGGKFSIGAKMDGSYGFNGYMAECVLVDGSALGPTSFGETDSITGIWKPKDVSSLSLGTTGFHMNFDDSSNVGAVQSGTSQGNFDKYNLTAADQATDTPTNNFCTGNNLVRFTNPSSTVVVDGATFMQKGANGRETISGTMYASSGKWYAEVQPIYPTGNNFLIGVMPSDSPIIYLGGQISNFPGSASGDGGVSYISTGNKYLDGGNSSYGNAYSSGGSVGPVIGIALDMDNGKVYFSISNVWQNSGDPTSGATGTGAIDLPSPEKSYSFHASIYNSGNSVAINYGGYTYFTISSGESDANGYGTFEYAPPSGYYALCTKNLEEFG